MSGIASKAGATRTQTPSTWVDVSLGEVCDLYQPKTIAAKDMVDDGDYPVYGANGVIGRYDDFNHSDSEVLLSCRGNVGTVNVSEPRSWITGNAMVCAPRTPAISKSCLAYMLEAIDLRQAITGTAQKQITRRSLAPVRLSLPPPDEQQCIVEILEEQLSRLDAALDSVRVVREKGAQFRRSLLHAAFTGALTGRVPPERRYPPSWEKVRLSDIADVGWGDLQTTKASYSTEGYLAYSATGPDGLLPDYAFDRDGIVVSAIGAACGKTWLATGKWSCIKNTMRILPTSKHADIQFLYHQLSDPVIWPKRGSGQPFIAQKDARAVEVLLPPLSEQQRIVGILEEQLSRLDAPLAIADQIEQRSAALRRSLLHAAFTGRLTEQWREHADV